MIIIPSNCEFDREFFKDAGYKIGADLYNSFINRDWSSFCTNIYKSGWCEGMQGVFETMFECPDFETLRTNWEAMKQFTCAQRAILPLYYAYSRWPLNQVCTQDILQMISDDMPTEPFMKCERGKRGLGERISDIVVDLSGFGMWCVIHGAESHVLREQTNLRQVSTIEKIERKRGAGVFLAMGFRGVCYYSSLLDKWLMPEFMKLVEARNAEAERKHQEFLARKADRAIRAQTERLYGRRYVESERVATEAVYSETFSNNAFAGLKR